ncbi:DUF4097 family beta strand repeat-containing protein [Lentilactobacillus raoultii]|uniref:DUF4097 family beta strand repeat-containing protein n=1 Tax=Lentilactobacillus raoultii TaxID=1987503 RepID=A0ABW3PJ64_9LACO|nr:DUF4097 family beta strand repeat-containing protein [Lentilactobacillus raoultii]
MKKTIIIGLITMTIGLVMTVIALGHSGLQSVYWGRHGFKVAENQSSRTLKTYQREFSGNISQISFSADNQVEIRSGQVAKPQISYISGTKMKKDGEKLTINAPIHRHHSWVGFDINNDGDDNGNIVVTLPKKNRLTQIDGQNQDETTINHLSLKTIQINGDTDLDMTDVTVQTKLALRSMGGDTSFNNVNAPSISSDTSDGDIDLRNCHFKTGASDLSTDDGDISVAGSHFERVSMHSDDGDISFRGNQILKALSASTEDGDIDGQVPDRKRAEVTTHVDDDPASIFGHQRSTWNKGKGSLVTYELSTDDGDITVE